MITITGANEHNLDDVDAQIGDGITAVTGVSGSGKTSLIFDTLYHEARRRFLETYAIGSVAERLPPADVADISGLGPAVALGQNLLNRNPNSTIASAAGLSPFLRIFYARFGSRSCPECGAELLFQGEDEIVERVAALSGKGACYAYALLVHGAFGSHHTLLQFLARQFGADALRIDDGPYTPGTILDPSVQHDIAVLLTVSKRRLAPGMARDIVERVRALGATAMLLQNPDEHEMLSLAPVCLTCGRWFSPLEPSHFHQPCPHCSGAGCSLCAGTGLLPEAAAVLWQNMHLPDLLTRSVSEVQRLFAGADLDAAANRLYFEIERRLQALQQVGLGYLSLDRSSPTLSRGEAQRIRLAVTLTSRLQEMIHVFDEPTIGQHPADTKRFLPVLRTLPGPVIFVEHDKTAVAVADQVLDIGPGAGEDGGRIVFNGPPAELWQADTASGRCFSGRTRLPQRTARPRAADFLILAGANLHNLADITVRFPLGRLTAVTGVSGSGKSTLIEHVLSESLSSGAAIGCASFSGPPLKPVIVDQSPIGRNPRSNPATYTKLADLIRDLYANATGLSPSHFSFNRPEGACPACSGMGAVEIKMRFLPSTWIPCAACGGQRFKDEILDAVVDFNGRRLSIADFYKLTVREVMDRLTAVEWLAQGKLRQARHKLRALLDIGLGYLTLGQPSPSLSGGEAQRVKLARFLGRRSLERQLLILDEPTTGLHEQDVAVLLDFLNRLVDAGGTVIAVEHNLDFIRAADWIVDLGPGAGPQGGKLLFNGPVEKLAGIAGSLTAAALGGDEQPPLPPAAEAIKSRSSPVIEVRGAKAHNLRDVDVTFPKQALTVVTGVSGSGKSSLVMDVLEVEARRRFLETLSLYERQSAAEGQQAQVDSVTGLGVTIAIGARWRGRFDQRATVGTATELTRHLAVLLAWHGERQCLRCGGIMARVQERDLIGWRCANCGEQAAADPRQFLSTTYAAACMVCNGVGTLQVPNQAKLIIDPKKPLCGGAMHSPGFFPKGYLCKPFNQGYDMVRALGERYGFDPALTPWQEMSAAAQQAFLYGDEQPLLVHYRSRSRSGSREIIYPGFYGFIRDWDVGGTYTDTRPCPECGGAKLRPASLAATLGGKNMAAFVSMSLSELAAVMAGLQPLKSDQARKQVASSAVTVKRRLAFLQRVGLGYLHLERSASTLSAGEAQRIRLAGLLGSGLRSLMVLLDEPTRGLHPSEVDALIGALHELRDEGNTLIVVEHDAQVIRSADKVIDMGPGAGRAGGTVVAQGKPDEVAAADTPTGRWLQAGDRLQTRHRQRHPRGWLTVSGARANNLRGDTVRFPLGMLTGICGVSGSGKSTLLIDTVGRALAPKKQTTSVAYEATDPGTHESIEGAPKHVILVDQAKAGVSSPLTFLGLEQPLRRLYAATGEAHALAIGEKGLQRSCSACKGRGMQRFDMGFLPTMTSPCEICHGSGYLPEAWQIHWQGICLPELVSRTIQEAYELLQDETPLARPLAAAVEVGLGYLVLRQPAAALSGGEAQRLKIARELARKAKGKSLFMLDEPTVGLHLADVQVLLDVLERLVKKGHTVVVIEHHAALLAACDWLVELGPGGGPQGGHLIGAGTPQNLAAGNTPTAPYLRAVLREMQSR